MLRYTGLSLTFFDHSRSRLAKRLRDEEYYCARCLKTQFFNKFDQLWQQEIPKIMFRIRGVYVRAT
jgi:hypothetical protein